MINSSPKNPIKLFQPFTPIYVPVGIGYLLAVAERESIGVRCVDEQVEDDVVCRVKEHLKEFKPPYIFGFSVLTAAFKYALKAAAELKRLYPDSVVCFGGIHPTAAPDEVLSYPQVDVVLRGEGEKPLMELYGCVKGGKDFRHIKGLSYRQDGRVVHNEAAAVIEDLDSLPPFPYHLFDSEKYDLGFVISSRGCPHKCIFCSNRITTGRRYRTRSAGDIAEELDMLYRKYKKRDILFLDDNLLVNKKRLYSLFDEIRGRGLHEKMNFSFQARGDNVSEELLKDLYDSGFKSVFFGMETASEEIMKVLKKGETVAQCADAVRMAKKAGLHVSATFIYALPGETHEDRMAAVGMCKNLSLDMVRFNNATPYPGTELFEIAKKDGRLKIHKLYENFNAVSTFVESPFTKIPFSYVPEGNTEGEIRRDILYSYFRFYIDINKLKGIFTRPERGVRWFSAGKRLKEIAVKIPPLILLSGLMLFKFVQLLHYSVIRKDTAISLKFFLGTFKGLWPGNED